MIDMYENCSGRSRAEIDVGYIIQAVAEDMTKNLIKPPERIKHDVNGQCYLGYNQAVAAMIERIEKTYSSKLMRWWEKRCIMSFEQWINQQYMEDMNAYYKARHKCKLQIIDTLTKAHTMRY